MDITVSIETSECIGNANIKIELMKERLLEDEIITSDCIPNKVGVYYISLSVKEEKNDGQKYYFYMRNYCGFTATGNIHISYDY